MDIFTVQNGKAIPSIHALLIEPYKTIWEKDTTENKEVAIKKFTFIELLCSRRKSNPFSGYSEDVRKEKIIENIYGNLDSNPLEDPLVEEGVKVYKDFLYKASPTLSFLEAALDSAEKVKFMIKNVDFDERTRGGAAVYKPGDITRALKDTEDVVKNLEALRDKVESELLQNSKTRGNREVGHFER